MKKTVLILLVICLLITGCKKKEKEEPKYLICIGQIEETYDNIGMTYHKITIDFTKENIIGIMDIYIDLLESYSKESTKELIQERVCKKDYLSCETSIDNNKIIVKISGDLEQILGTDKYKNYLDIKNYLLDNNYKCEE